MKAFLNGAFYDSKIHKTIPAGAVQLTDDEWRTLLDGQAAGQLITAGADGRPVLEDQPALALAGRKSIAISELWRNYKAHQQSYVDPEDLTLAVVCAAKGSTKGAAIQAWVLSLWAEYYTKRDAIDAATDTDALSAIDLSAEAFGAPSYTIRELNDEARAALSN